MKDDKTARWMRLLIKIVLVFLVLIAYVFLNDLVLESLSEGVTSPINPAFSKSTAIYLYIFSPVALLPVMLAMLWIGNDLKLKRRSKVKRDSLVIALILFALYILLCIPYVFYGSQTSEFFVGLALFFLSRGADRAFLKVLLVIAAYFLINSAVTAPARED